MNYLIRINLRITILRYLRGYDIYRETMSYQRNSMRSACVLILVFHVVVFVFYPADIMYNIQIIKNIYDRWLVSTKNPETYLSIAEDESEEVKKIVKELYDFLKRKEIQKRKTADALESLTIQDFDEEQIWQQICLQNDSINNSIVADVARVLSQTKRLTFPLQDTGDDDSSQVKEESFSLREAEQGTESESETSSVSSSQQGHVNLQQRTSSEVDDRFFKLSEMENYLDLMEKENDNRLDTSEEVDYFNNDFADKDKKRLYYSDFFDDVDADKCSKQTKLSTELNGKKRKRKSSSFAAESDVNECFGGTSGDYLPAPKSSFEEKQDRLHARIGELEKTLLQEKPWQLKGEVRGGSRPHNSLLEELVEFDVGSRPAPVMTEQTTMRLEDIIKDRIVNQLWDDVIRKAKPLRCPSEYKRKLVLDQEKSKVSLAEVYEKEYLQQKNSTMEVQTETASEVPPSHAQITKAMKKIFTLLDALSNKHYTPGSITPEVKIVSNLPAVTIEEAIPTGVSDAALLAPQEVKVYRDVDRLGKSERSSTDKKRERRLKKQRQKNEFKRKKLVAAVHSTSPGKTGKNRDASKSTKDKNRANDYLKTSNTFFTKLQDVASIGDKMHASGRVKAQKKIPVKKSRVESHSRGAKIQS